MKVVGLGEKEFNNIKDESVYYANLMELYKEQQLADAEDKNELLSARTFGLPFDDVLRAQAEATKGFVKFIDDEYFEVELQGATDEEFVYFKRNNGERVIV